MKFDKVKFDENHRYFDDHIQPIINCMLVLTSLVLGYLVSLY
ncbi:hypothetical protein [Lactiplantibacillus plantarum]|nr:hypothetical protein [Lactiplantibacillus plantarum]